MSDLSDLLVQYDAWEDTRTAIGVVEEAGTASQAYLSDAWEESDREAIGLIRLLARAARPPVLLEFVVQYADRGDYLDDDEPSDLEILCPSCGAEDVREIDDANAWNELEVGQYGAVVAYLGDMGDRERIGWICATCTTHLAAPDGFTIENWL